MKTMRHAKCFAAMVSNAVPQMLAACSFRLSSTFV